MSQDLRNDVEALLEQLKPLFEPDGVVIELVGVRGGLVSIHVDTSGCEDCSSPQEVVEGGLERLILEKVPGVTGVIAI